ncbi:MerC domain-containing protein [Flavobacteriaceae bacterium S356]|uniref:MerC domain-containing protein n=1 Tax=Asprobacillus argus TaxID=3076534 RepID=A0ABU3LAW7_9FLAO|nr:MerC domain-containing protein [Flavobacteriaceae bacterium S356]
MINKLSTNSDPIGAMASSLCLLHCLATPLIFIIQPLAAEDAAPGWWKSLDYIFLFVSFFAVVWSVQNTSKNWMRYALWISWIALTVALINEKLELFSLTEFSIYIPAIALVFLHFYNRKYCQCADEECCVNVKENEHL